MEVELELLDDDVGRVVLLGAELLGAGRVLVLVCFEVVDGTGVGRVDRSGVVLPLGAGRSEADRVPSEVADRCRPGAAVGDGVLDGAAVLASTVELETGELDVGSSVGA